MSLTGGLREWYLTREGRRQGQHEEGDSTRNHLPGAIQEGRKIIKEHFAPIWHQYRSGTDRYFAGQFSVDIQNSLILCFLHKKQCLERFAQRQISVTEGIDPIFLSKHIFIMAAESATGRFIGL